MSLLHPRSIAVIGASSQEGKVGHDIFKNLLTQGFKGDVFPVNVKGGEILGKAVFTSVKDIPGIPDLAIIVIPASVVPEALKECGEKGIASAVVISAGFSEVHTDDGKKLEEEIIAIAKQYSIHLVGPNCLGIVRPGISMNASFAKDMPPVGSIALVSQSGATAVALMDRAPQEGIGFSMMASIGNKAVMDECDWLELCEKDSETEVIAFYLESIKDGRRFRDIAARVTQTKPIVLLKAGVSDHGRQAAASHTGALAGSDSAIDALCIETGIHRARTSEDFFDLLSALSTQPELPTNNIAIITNAGGPGILATDAASFVRASWHDASASLQLPALSSAIETDLRTKLPASASTHNPIDVIGDAGADRYEAAITACREDPNIDGLVIILTPQVMTPCVEVAETIVKLMKTAPLMPVCACFMGGESVSEAISYLQAHHIPTYPTPERAVRAIAALRNKCHPEPVEGSTEKPILRQAQHDKDDLLKNKSGLLDEDTTKQLFALYNLPMPKQALATTAEEAVTLAEQIGYPVIAKISSPQILHKTDIGGVRANLNNREDVMAAWHDIRESVSQKAPQATIEGILIQQFLPVGDEFIVGATRDPSFGPLIMAGLGGIYTELFRDTSFRIAPVSRNNAYQMLTELKAWKLLLGMRGKSIRDIDALAALIERVSVMMTECPSIKELDLNPVLVFEDSVVIADAKVVIE
jgi:acetyl coenzyme A synthetase (ADP forming)-like protein